MLLKLEKNQFLPFNKFFQGFSLIEIVLFFCFQLIIAVISIYFPIIIPVLLFIVIFPGIINRSPEVGIIFILFFLMMITQPSSPLVELGGLKIQDLLLALMIGFWLAEHIVFKKTFPIDKSLLSIAIFTFVMVGIFTFFKGYLAGYPHYLLFEDFREFFYLILFWYVLDKIRSRGQVRVFTALFILLINIFSIYSLLMNFLDKGGFSETAEIRFVIPASAYLSIGIILMLSIWLYESGTVNKIGLLISIIFPFAALILSLTRGHWVACFLGVIFVLIFSRAENKKIGILMLSGAAIIALILLNFLSGLSISVLLEGLSQRGEEAFGIDISLAMRIQEIGLIIREFPKHPFLGHGLGATLFMFRPFRGWVHWWDIHNNYFEFVYEMGLIGLAAYLFWVYAFFKRCYQVFRRARDQFYQSLILGFAGTYVYLMVVSLTSGFVFRIDTIPYIAVMMGLIIVIDRHISDKPAENAR